MKINARTGFIHAVVIVFVVYVAYVNTLGMSFVWDDIYHIRENPVVQSVKNIPIFFTSDDGEGAGAGDNPYYRPITTLTFALDYTIWGDSPFGFHLTNIILHIVVCIMLYVLACRIGGEKSTAFIAALLFGVHPAYQEAVTYISARADIIAALFLLPAFIYYVGYRDSSGSKKGYLVISLIFYFLSLLSKIMTITFPAIILLYEWLIRQEKTKKIAASVSYFFLPVAAFCSLRFLVIDMTGWYHFPLLPRIFTCFGIIVNYLKILLFPFGLKLFYAINAKETFFQAGVILPLVALIILAFSAVSCRKRFPRAVFFTGWILVALFPVSGLPGFIYPALMAERYLYIPAIGFCLGTGFFCQHLLQRADHRKFVIPVIVAVITVLSIATAQRNKIWNNGFSLWETANQKAPKNEYVLNRLALVYVRNQDLNKAELLFRELVALYPYSENFYNLALTCFNNNKLDLAEQYYLKAFELDAANVKALYGAGLVYLKRNELKKAMVVFMNVIDLDPGHEQAKEALKMIINCQHAALQARNGMGTAN